MSVDAVQWVARCQTPWRLRECNTSVRKCVLAVSFLSCTHSGSDWDEHNHHLINNRPASARQRRSARYNNTLLRCIRNIESASRRQFLWRSASVSSVVCMTFRCFFVMLIGRRDNGRRGAWRRVDTVLCYVILFPESHFRRYDLCGSGCHYDVIHTTQHETT